MLELPYQVVLVPVDFSAHALAAATFMRGALRQGARMHVVTVLEHLHVADPISVWGAAEDRDRIAKAEAWLREHIGDGPEIAVHVAVGSPPLEIVTCAHAIGADLIALPTHGRTGAERVLIGSVAERVARLAPCAVLVLRLP